MKAEDIKKRNAFADALEAVAESAKNVPSGGWDVPTRYIAEECRRWARCYRVLPIVPIDGLSAIERKKKKGGTK